MTSPAGVRLTIVAVAVCVAGLGRVGARQLPPATQSEPAGALSGVVVDALSGQPLADATVRLRIDGVGAPANQSRTVFSDAKGRFVFSRLPPSNRYVLSASRMGYVPREDRGPWSTIEPSRPIRLALGDRQWRFDVRVELFRPAVITGRVVDERGEPVVGAYVQTHALFHLAGRPQYATAPGARTDDRGEYRITGLAPGRYVVSVPYVAGAVPAATPNRARAPTSPTDQLEPALALDGAVRLVLGRFPALPPPGSDGWLRAYRTIFHPHAGEPATAVPVEVSYGEERTGIDFRLEPVATRRISGVVDGPAEARTGLVLRLMMAGHEGLGFSGETASTVVPPDGHFTFVGVPAGRYTIVASRRVATYTYYDAGVPIAVRAPAPRPPGFVMSSGESGDVPLAPPGTRAVTHLAHGDQGYSGTTPVVVDRDDVTGIVVVLRRGVTLSGRVIWDAPSPPEFASIIGQPLTAEPATGSLTSTGTGRSSPGDPGGAFAITGLEMGEYFLRVRGFPGWIAKSIVLGGRDYVDRPFDTSSGRDIADIVVTVTDKGAAVEGRVSDSRGAPVRDDAAVIIFPVTREQWTDYGLTPPRIRSVRSSPTGSYVIDSLPAGDYFLVAVDAMQAGAWTDPAFFERASASATRASVDWGERRLLSLTLKTLR
jgi:hypothetical protein